MKIELASEVEQSNKRIIFDLRRHKQIAAPQYDTNLYLTMIQTPALTEYPMVIDGKNDKIIIRKKVLEEAGFIVEIVEK